MDRIHFKINDVYHSVGSEVTSDLTLLDYIRNYAELRGTKYMCREGGCGACIVSAVKEPNGVPFAVNACLVSVTSCQGWEITTVEKIGNRLKGYNVIQTTLAENNGTQCGYCTPGWVMAMYSLIHSNPGLTRLDIEKSFGSNVCRCTGYRPILEAFKKFAVDHTDPIKILDIEELHLSKKCAKSCPKTECDEDEWCFVSKDEVKVPSHIEIDLHDGKKWFKVYEITEIFNILHREGDDSYMLVAGNTAKGAYPIEEYPRTLIDISDVAELKGHYVDQNLVIGSGTTLTETMHIFQKMSQTDNFTYLQKLYEHLELVAHIPVKNIGTIAGNLMIKYKHNEFPSDVFLLLDTIGAMLTIIHPLGVKNIVTMQQFLRTNMRGSVILNVMLPPLSNLYKLETFKIMPKAQNAHAIVNAGFLFKVDNLDIVYEARIAYGGLSPTFTRAMHTEKSLVGKKLFTNETLQMAIAVLKNEMVVTENPPEPSVNYRRQLTINLFFKGLLSLCPKDWIASRYWSGGIKLKQARPVSKAQQIYETDPSLWPLNKPIPKVEALIQCSGEAKFTEDFQSLPNEVFAAFVLTTVPKGHIKSIDPIQALNCPGVVAFYSAADIPGINSFTPGGGDPVYLSDEEILCNGEVKYFNQPLGIIVAISRPIAERASKLVKVTYTNVTAPVLDIKVAKRDLKRNTLYFSASATEKGNETQKVLTDELNIYWQYHFTMETLVCVTNPIEQGIQIYPASQWMDIIHVMASRALKIPQNKIDIQIRRLGGAYGAKVSRISQVAIACSLVTFKLNQPCRFILPLTTNTRAVGKRLPNSTNYEMGVSLIGAIQYINMNIFIDNGYVVDETLAMLASGSYFNCYDKSRWNFKIFNTVTDTASNTWCRAPITLEVIAAAETYMERISYELHLDPIEVRLQNLDYARYSDIKELLGILKLKSDFDKRKNAISQYNKDNRWKKRGLRTSFLRWEAPQTTAYYDVNLSVYHGDGTVSIAHAGIEMGQGVNTKAVQIAAYMLKIPISKIQIKPNDTMISPNSSISAASFTSQYVGVGVQKCCEELLRRLEPIRAKLINPSWEELIAKSYSENIDLQTHGFVAASDFANYDIFGVTMAEVEIDVLTGEFEILRVDLIQDVGLSTSPEIDIGQVEGAFVMGLGYWTSEHLVYNINSGELLTDRTWNYYVPQARDIPQDFRVYFRKKSYSVPRFLGAKTTGEPSTCMAVVIPFALREAIAAARFESGISVAKWFKIDGPYSVETVCLACESNSVDYRFH